MSELKVYIGHNYPEVLFDELDFVDWCAVVADSEESAMAMVAARVDTDVREGEDWKSQIVIDKVVDAPDSKWFGHALTPRYVTHCQELRILGFAEPHEERCDHCDLAANGIDAFYVCPDCRICKECGGCCCMDDDE